MTLRVGQMLITVVTDGVLSTKRGGREMAGPALSIALAKDTGSSSTDRITSYPVIKGIGLPNSFIIIREGGVVVGIARSDATGAWSFIPAGITDGAHTLTASQIGNTGTATLSFTLDRVAPVVSVALVADTGSSSTDRITSNPAIKGTGQANTLVTITGRRRHARHDDGGRHGGLELHAGRSGRWRPYIQRQPNRPRRQHRNGNAELHARQRRRRW